MIHHCIRMTLKPGLSEDEVAAGIERMRDATTRIPSIRSWVVGRDFGGDYEYSAISVVEDLDGYEEMMNHPAHLEIDRLGLPLVEKFMSFDITDDPDPEMGAKIAAIHQRRQGGDARTQTPIPRPARRRPGPLPTGSATALQSG